jgi:hypothetical protein
MRVVQNENGNKISLPKNENSEDLEQVVEDNEPEAVVHLDVIQTNAMEVQREVVKPSLGEKNLVEENEKLRLMLEKLLEAGRNQQDIMSGLNEREGIGEEVGEEIKEK